jgi:hypothetical protein
MYRVLHNGLPLARYTMNKKLKSPDRLMIPSCPSRYVHSIVPLFWGGVVVVFPLKEGGRVPSLPRSPPSP